MSPTGCVLFDGAVDPNGYGRQYVDGQKVYAHRLAYEAAFGPIPDGMVIDHVWERGCRHRHCIEPSHLEAVTSGENTRRGSRLIGSCPQGHAYDEVNTRIAPKGDRRCRTCHRENERRRRAQKTAAC